MCNYISSALSCKCKCFGRDYKTWRHSLQTADGTGGGGGGVFPLRLRFRTCARKSKAAKQPRRSGETTGGRHLRKPGNRPAEGKLEKGTMKQPNPPMSCWSNQRPQRGGRSINLWPFFIPRKGNNNLHISLSTKHLFSLLFSLIFIYI